MWFEQLIRRETGCATYLVGSTTSGEALVFDPLWDIAPYLEMAQQKGARIRYVIDSHIHADHVSGARRLARATGAELILPRLAAVTYPATRVADGDKLHMGEVTLEMVHTPGHRPEMMSLLVTDQSRGDQPWCMLTGDSLLVGDLGRPDLAQDGEAGAQTLFTQTLPRLRQLPDFVEVYPGHVAGSTCGRVSSGKVISTIGYERRFNPLLQISDRRHFADLMLANLPARPANMGNIEAINAGQRPLTLTEPNASALSPYQVAEQIAAGGLVLDVRASAHFAAGHLAGAYHVPLPENANFEQWVGWITPPDKGLILLAENEMAVAMALHKLAFVGLARQVQGYVRGGIDTLAAHHPLRTVPSLAVEQLYERLHHQDNFALLDVRERYEWAAGHLAQALHHNFKQLRQHLAELSLALTEPLAVICASGRRSLIAASILLHYGYTHVFNVSGGMQAWQAAGLPITG